MPVMTRCSECGTEFKSAVQFDKEGFEEPANVLTGFPTNCPKGHDLVIDKDDLFWSDETP